MRNLLVGLLIDHIACDLAIASLPLFYGLSVRFKSFVIKRLWLNKVLDCYAYLSCGFILNSEMEPLKMSASVSVWLHK